jgi:hypothetical protein
LYPADNESAIVAAEGVTLVGGTGDQLGV